MGNTLAEKFLASHTNNGKATAGDIVEADVDLLMVHEVLGSRIIPILDEMDFKKVPLFIEANNSENLINLEKFSGRLSDRVAVLSSGQRMYLHLAGVMASNFTNHFMAIAEKIMKDHGMDFLLFRSLMEETIDKAFSKGPQEAQTGPAIRGDQKIIAKHTDLLDQYPEFRELYVKISGSIASIRAWQ